MLACADHIAGWTRERFGLAPRSVVLVNEVACTLPGFPPRYTVIVFWTGGLAQRHHLKVFKAMAQVTPDDLPPYWMRGALAVSPTFSCDCC
jgi:nitrate reductase delta subunit